MAAPAGAAHHAVLIGIRNYPGATPLFGPLNDVRAVEELLVGRYGFPAGNTTILTDGSATKAGILDALVKLEHRTRAGDFVFVYFSGHGTSDFDRPVPGGSIGAFTGAILPYDFKLEPDDPARTLDRLIIGRRDLLPIFERLDRDRRLLVVFDACFSANAIRARRGQPGVAKYVPLPFARPESRDAAPGPPGVSPDYPYQNLIYISAADETELAVDLPKGARFDGGAHGALTDALLVGLSGQADTNRDRVVTYEELYRFARNAVQAYGHTPQIRHRGTLDRPVFDKPGILNTHLGIVGNGPLTVGLKATDTGPLASRIAALPGVRLARGGGFGLLVEQETPGAEGPTPFSVYLPSGDRLCRVDTVDQVVDRVRHFGRVRDLVDLKNPIQNRNVWIEAGERGGQSVFFGGDPLDVTIRSEFEGYLLLFNVDSRGNVNVIAPSGERPKALVKAGAPVTLGGFSVFPPYGVEYLKVFVFGREIGDFARFASASPLAPASRPFGEFERALNTAIRAEPHWAETSIQIVTLAGTGDP